MSDFALLFRCVLLQDDQGLAQCLLLNDSLLDLQALHKHSQRRLLPLTQIDMMTALRRGQLKLLPGSERYYQLPAFVDSALAASGDLATDSEGCGLAQLRDQLNAKQQPVRHLPVAIAPDALQLQLPAAEHDCRQITDSLRSFTSLRIRQRLEETLEIPPLPATATRILKLRGNPNASVSELSDIVEMDPSLAAQVVSWAASPYYAATGKINSVQDAIVRILGFDLVSNLAAGLVLGRVLALPREAPFGFTPFWLQAVYCSTAVEQLTRLMPASRRPVPGLMYLAGLLHNFGYLILAHTFPPHFSSLCRHIEANPAISHIAIEHHLIGFSREQISAWLMQSWNMPEEISIALRYQQDASYQGPHAAYANLIHVAMRLLREHGIGDAPPQAVDAGLYQRLGLDEEHCRQAIETLVNSKDIAVNAELMGC